MKTITIARVRTHGCTRCQGDLILDLDDSVVDYYCLQCGRRADLASLATPTRPATV